MPFIDARALPGGSEIVADLMIIGGGIAGLTMAREWAGSGRSVAVLESGGRTVEGATQDLYQGSGVMRAPGAADLPFDAYLTQSRVRALGGSGLVWGGKCVPLDPADFAERDWVPGSGWPVSRRSLQPFYDRACDLLEIPRFPPGETSPPDEPDRPRLVIDKERAFFSAPRAFTRYSGAVDPAAYDRFRDAPAAAGNVAVYLNANVVELRLDPGRRGLERLDLACLDGRRHTARARAYVLAAGGIENARLLLASTSVNPRGVGNDADLVGRCFQGHVAFPAYGQPGARAAGVYLTGTDQDMRLYVEGSARKDHCVLASRLSSQRKRRAGNFTVTLNRFQTPPADPERLALGRLAAALDDGGGGQARDLSCYFMTEHMPNPESRVTLGSTSDPLGMPRVNLEWVWSKADWDSLESSIDAFARALGASGLGRVGFPAERSQYLAVAGTSRHHMGTTRMHADPAKGVVDADSRVHGLANLYVAGSSVFPTSGIGNPTLTLLAMTLRLSDHLKRQMARAA